MAATDERWEMCLHESAHCVTASACNSWDTGCLAVVFEDGSGGVAYLPAGLSDFARVVAAAAGAHGERLAEHFSKPERRNALPVPTAGSAERVRAAAVNECARDAHCRAIREQPDEIIVARYCCESHPTDPHDWRRTYFRVHGMAKRLVWRYRERIAAAATSLFHAGSVSLPGNPEQESVFFTPAEQRALTTHHQKRNDER